MQDYMHTVHYFMRKVITASYNILSLHICSAFHLNKSIFKVYYGEVSQYD